MINQIRSDKNYDPNKEIRTKKSMLKLDLCDFSDAYIVVKGNITVVKKTFTAMILRDQIIQILMQLILIMQKILHLVKKSWFSKIMHHYQLYFKN